MSDLSRSLGNSGGTHDIVHNDKVFKFRLVDQEAKSVLEKRMYKKARDAVVMDREVTSPAEFMERLDKLGERYQEGEFAFEGERGQKLLQTPAGILMFLSVLCGESENELINLLSSKSAEVQAVLKVILHESYPDAQN
jgi:hypothetical protein